MAEARIRVGIGGWDYEPWRGTFYPPGLAKTSSSNMPPAARRDRDQRHLLQAPAAGAVRRLGEVGTGRLQFAIKGSRFCSNRKLLGEAGEAVGALLRPGLQPSLVTSSARSSGSSWRRRSSIRTISAPFSRLLPKSHAGVKLSHAVEPRHESFRNAQFVAMAREAGVAIVFADADDYPCIPDLSGDFVYARLQRCVEAEATGYGAGALDRWVAVAKAWARGESPSGFPYVDQPPPVRPRDAYMSLHQRRQAPRAPGGAGADGAAMNPLFADQPTSIFAHMSSLAASMERSISARASPISAGRTMSSPALRTRSAPAPTNMRR
jgi:uncharacterized protein YecE (DUF72 family)